MWIVCDVGVIVGVVAHVEVVADVVVPVVSHLTSLHTITRYFQNKSAA